MESDLIQDAETARTRRIKCDEKKPCGLGTSKGIECKQTDFIVQNKLPAYASPTSKIPQDSGPPKQQPEHTSHNAESTYDVFRQEFPASEEPRRLENLSGAVGVTVTEEIVKLLAIYQNGIGTWQDVPDHSQIYQPQILRSAMSSPLLTHLICALSDKQRSLIGDEFIWEPVAARQYRESLGLLIVELNNSETSREIVISATIAL
ncbi:hypothetical protein BJX99DRAFT_62 [Aspergillus californicus]